MSLLPQSMKTAHIPITLLLALCLVVAAMTNSPATARSVEMHIKLRTWIHPFKNSSEWTAVTFEQNIASNHTAIIICDMWDKHWCKGATTRVEGLARRMKPVLERARANSILIIHAPSETMPYYANTPGRLLAEQAVKVDPPAAIVPVINEPPLPIDDSDGGCDTPGDKQYKAWSRETPLLKIEPGDVISDDGHEIYNVLRQHGITTVLMMGVHANMCILNRSFGIRQLTKWGVRCILVRDLTDAMYNPASRPYVSHAAGTELVVEYIEKYWAPSVSSNDLLEQLGTSS
jgi:nicotinamidase-related amidase